MGSSGQNPPGKGGEGARSSGEDVAGPTMKSEDSAHKGPPPVRLVPYYVVGPEPQEPIATHLWVQFTGSPLRIAGRKGSECSIRAVTKSSMSRRCLSFQRTAKDCHRFSLQRAGRLEIGQPRHSLPGANCFLRGQHQFIAEASAQ